MNDVETADGRHGWFSVVIPAHNEEHRIGETLDTLRSELHRSECSEILLVDDDSTDQTLAVVDRLVHGDASSIPVRVIRVESGRGKGAAIRSGIASAQTDVAVLLDADLPVSTDELAVLASHARSTDLVLGSRRMVGSSFEVPQPVARRLGGLLFRTCARVLGFRGGSDPQCGAKALRVSTVGPIVAECASNDFALDAELIERCRRAGRSIVEVPVRWCHRPGSTVRPVRGFLRTVRSLRAARASVIGARAVAPSARPSSAPNMTSAHPHPELDSTDVARGARIK